MAILTCSLSIMSALKRIMRCFEVALKESLIASAISPTDVEPARFKYFKIKILRLLANAFKIFSSSFSLIFILYQKLLKLTIRLFARIRDVDSGLGRFLFH